MNSLILCDKELNSSISLHLRRVSIIEGPMGNLLQLAIEAHGGLERWRQFNEVKANVSITGALWHLKGQPDVLKNVQVVAQLHRQHLVTHLIGKDRRTIFTAGEVSIESESGVIEETRVDPATSFRGQSLDTPWDMLHVAYFASYALWSYITIPFLYTYPGFVTEEIAPWEEDSEQWRALKITFPDSTAGHSRNQISYFGPDGLLRRHEYTVDVLGNAPGLNYASDYQAISGLMVPHKRRVFAYDGEKRKVADPLLVAIDLCEVDFS